jgi:adenosine deaminase
MRIQGLQVPIAELHRHLDVCTRPSTLHELARNQGIPTAAVDLDSFRRKALITEPMSDLGTVLSQFRIFQLVLRTPEILARVAFEAAEDCYREGIRYAELRFSPSFVAEHSKLPYWEILEGFEAGVRKARSLYPDLELGLICIASRDYGIDSVAETVEFFLKNDDRFVGIDLAGDETAWPNAKFEEAFKPAVRKGSNITIHAGESTDSQEVWIAIERLGARRIGHGVRSIQDPSLVRFLSQQKICLEICPTSNWLTQCTPQLENHPIAPLLRAGVPVCINTDDPGIFALTLPGEVQVAQQKIGLSEQEIRLCFEHAWQSRFKRATN